MRQRTIALWLICVLAGGGLVAGGVWRIAGAALLCVGVVVALDLDRLHREHIGVALTLSASSSIPQLRNRLAHERRQRSGRR